MSQREKNSSSIGYICKRLKIRYVLHELKNEGFADQKQRIAVALNVTKKFCDNPIKNVNEKFLNSFEDKELRKVLGAYILGKLEHKHGSVTKKQIIDYILQKVNKK
jgi:hypothetical protein